MREMHDQWFGGNGGESMQKAYRLKERLDKAFYLLSGMQQPPRPCDPKESGAIYRKLCKNGEKEVRDIAEDIFCALTGKEAKIEGP